jgi:glutaminase
MLGFMMKKEGAFPNSVKTQDDLKRVLEFYFACCSLKLTCEGLAMVAATLANGGVCPTTKKRVFKPSTVRDCLSTMDVAGMYDYSGKFSFSVGLPAKSGVAGSVFVVIPDLMGVCVWSPPLDENGNSVRAVEFFEHLSKKWLVHKFDNLHSLENGTEHEKRGKLRLSLTTLFLR